MSSQAPKVWADGPFKLLTSPVSTMEKDDPNNDSYAEFASNMSAAHNLLIRGLNSIYLQAPQVQPQDYKAFVGYAGCFVPCMLGHHNGEEKNLFPLIESHAGVPGLMNKEKDQHKEFHVGLEAMDHYLTGLKGREHDFDGKKLNHIIDSFGNILNKHLSEELDTILSLRQYGDKLRDANAWLGADGEKVMQELTFTGALPWCFLNHDVTYENGRWARWPFEAPQVILFVARHVASCWNWSWWKFAACDSYGRPKALYAGPKWTGLNEG